MQTNETTQTLRLHHTVGGPATHNHTGDSFFNLKRYPLTTDEKSLIWLLGGLLAALWTMLF